jgi:phage host-nuclease inhibitor protein Gam
MSAKSKKLKAEAAQFPVPQSHDECAHFIARIGEHQRERTIIETAMNDDLAKRKAAYEHQAKPHADQISLLTKGVHVFCEANRVRLTGDGRVKFHRFATGEIKWRMRPPSITVRGVEAVIGMMKSLGLAARFVRPKEEIDKEALLRDVETAKTIPGITVGQKEDFVVEPFATELEEVL